VETISPTKLFSTFSLHSSKSFALNAPSQGSQTRGPPDIHIFVARAHLKNRSNYFFVILNDFSHFLQFIAQINAEKVSYFI